VDLHISASHLIHTLAMASSEVDQATQLLSEYIGKTLRVHTDDKRVFVGQMKCTDRVCESEFSHLYVGIRALMKINKGMQHYSWLDTRI
jgi:hypothetical protein